MVVWGKERFRSLRRDYGGLGERKISEFEERLWWFGGKKDFEV